LWVICGRWRGWPDSVEAKTLIVATADLSVRLSEVPVKSDFYEQVIYVKGFSVFLSYAF
jgi:hypothetical protein